MAGHWSRVECEAIVDDYLSMLAAECRREPYSKAEHRRNLQRHLVDRSDGSIEYKHQNISAALIRAGHIYIPGYKPAWNYQSLLEDVVFDRLANVATAISRHEEALIEQSPQLSEIRKVSSLIVAPPEKRPAQDIQENRRWQPRKVDYAAREARNRRLGDRGEEFVLELERRRLAEADREDLVADVEWTSKVQGDGAGYDLRSFKGETDEPLYIEVKTTNSGKYQPFMMSAGEVSFSHEHADQFAIYRVFEFSKSPNIFILNGAVSDHVYLNASVFRATF